MFGFFSTGSARKDPKGGLQEGFGAGLIRQLLEEHHEILVACEELELALVKGRVEVLREHLALLEGLIHRHRMIEDGKLLLDIDKRFSHDPGVSRKVQGVRKERDRLRRRLVAFSDKLDRMEVTGDSILNQLRVDFERIGASLVSLMEDEERELFPLYGLRNLGDGLSSENLLGSLEALAVS